MSRIQKQKMEKGFKPYFMIDFAGQESDDREHGVYREPGGQRRRHAVVWSVSFVTRPSLHARSYHVVWPVSVSRTRRAAKKARCGVASIFCYMP